MWWLINSCSGSIDSSEAAKGSYTFFVKKSLVAKRDIEKGEKFDYNNLTAMRPLKGKSVDKLKNFLGKKSKKNYKKNQLI